MRYIGFKTLCIESVDVGDKTGRFGGGKWCNGEIQANVTVIYKTNGLEGPYYWDKYDFEVEDCHISYIDQDGGEILTEEYTPNSVEIRQIIQATQEYISKYNVDFDLTENHDYSSEP